MKDIKEGITMNVVNQKANQVEEVELKGYIVSFRCPTEELLTIKVDVSALSKDQYWRLVRELQDYLYDVDTSHAKRKPKYTSRKIDATHKRVVLERRNIIKFSPYPNRFSNQIKYIRTKLYNIINYHCITIQEEITGNVRRCIYLLPKPSLPMLNREVEILNNEIDGINREIRKYDLKPIKAILEQYGIEIPLNHIEIPHITLQVLPIRIGSMEIREWANRDPETARIIERTRREMILKAVEEVKKRLYEIALSISSAKSMDRVRNSLMRIREICNDLGLKALSKTVVEPLIDLTFDPQKCVKVLTTENTRKSYIDERISGLIRNMEELGLL